MLAVLITLIPGCWNEFIDCQRVKVRIALLPIMDVTTRWNSTVEMMEPAYQLWELTWEWLKNSKCSDYWPLFTTQVEWTIVEYIMEVFSPFQYWALWMSKRNTVTLHHVITDYNDMFNHMDGIMWAWANKKTQWKEDLYFAIKVACQKLSKYYAAVTPMASLFPTSAHILDPLRKLRSFGSGKWRWIFILRTTLPILPNARRLFWSIWRTNTVPSIDKCPALHPEMFRTGISSPLHRLLHLVNRLMITMIFPAMLKIT